MISCCSFFLIVDNDIHTAFPGSSSTNWVISVLKAIMLPLQEELWHFFLSDNKPGSLPYWKGNKNKCYNNNMDYKVCNHVMLMPMLMPMLSFYNKIHTWGQNIFFCWKRYVTEQVRKKLSWKWKPYLLRLRLIPAKEKQSARILKMPPYRCCGITKSGIQACTFILPLSVWIALIYFCHMITNLPAMVLTVDFGMVD